ncbi:MAG: hypothetical protein I8H75_02025 [Myxococcaceae bacterium]|nr:hypothetical protein [Myxococcaceae bacterium]MBH2006113.1 hypothetical protein [Myxococcaceae bacterium]
MEASNWGAVTRSLKNFAPGKPQQHGRHEQMHRTLKQAAAPPAQSDLQKQRDCFERFRRASMMREA